MIFVAWFRCDAKKVIDLSALPLASTADIASIAKASHTSIATKEPSRRAADPRSRTPSVRNLLSKPTPLFPSETRCIVAAKQEQLLHTLLHNETKKPPPHDHHLRTSSSRRASSSASALEASSNSTRSLCILRIAASSFWSRSLASRCFSPRRA